MKHHYTLKIGPKGEILLPREVRERLRLFKDQPITMKVVSDRIIIQRIDSLEEILREPAEAKVSYHALKHMKSEFD